jgi:hypothetical protein
VRCCFFDACLVLRISASGVFLPSLEPVRQSLHPPAPPVPKALAHAVLQSGRHSRSIDIVQAVNPRFIACEQSGSGTSAGLILIVDVAERLPIGVADDEASAVVIAGTVEEISEGVCAGTTIKTT